MRQPTIVIVSLGAIAITGVVFAVTASTSGAAAVGTLYLSLPLSAISCLRAWRFSRTALFVFSLGAMVPLMVGVMITWPHIVSGAPYFSGIAALFGGLAGMLSPSARAWYASLSAHRFLGLQ